MVVGVVKHKIEKSGTGNLRGIWMKLRQGRSGWRKWGLASENPLIWTLFFWYFIKKNWTRLVRLACGKGYRCRDDEERDEEAALSFPVCVCVVSIYSRVSQAQPKNILTHLFNVHTFLNHFYRTGVSIAVNIQKRGKHFLNESTSFTRHN